METQELLSMLAVQDEQEEEKKKEKTVARTKGFDPVLRIAEILEIHKEEYAAKQGYVEDLTTSFIGSKSLGTDHLAQDLKNLGIELSQEALKHKDLKEFVSSASKEIAQRIKTMPQTKIPELKGANYGRERKDFYQTEAGYFLPQDAEALIAAHTIKQKLNGLESVLHRVSNIDELSRLLFLNQLTSLVSPDRKRGICAEIKECELSEDSLIYVAMSLERETNVLSKIRKLRGLNTARSKAGLSVKSRLKKVAKTATHYRSRAEELVYKIYQSTGRVDLSYEHVDGKSGFEIFIKCLEAKIMSEEFTAVKPINPHELNSGRAILLRDMKGLKKGTLGKLENEQFKPSKGNTININCKDVVKIEKKETLELIILDEKPQAGDLVVITNGRNYASSKEGSWGYLREYLGLGISLIEFHHVTGDPYSLPARWNILNTDFKKAVFKKEEEKEKYTPKIQDKVRIKRTSQYAGQNDGEGEIIGIDVFNQDLPFIVKFENGQQHNYSAQDLERINIPAEEARKLRDRAKQERINKKKKKVERNRIRKIIHQTLDDIAECEEERTSEVKSCVEHLVKLGITPQTANTVVKHYLNKQDCYYQHFVKQGILMSDEESNKPFNRIQELKQQAAGGYKGMLSSIFDDIARDIGVFIDLSQTKIENENDLKIIREKIKQAYIKGYVKKGDQVQKPGLVAVIDGDFKGKIGEIRDLDLCQGGYHVIFPNTGKEHVKPDRVVPIQQRTFTNAARFVKGANVKINPESQYARQNTGAGVLQQDYPFVDDNKTHCKVIFEDGYMNFYKKEDLWLLTEQECKQAAIRRELPKLYAIVDKHFKAATEGAKELEALRANLRSEINSLGIKPEQISDLL